MKRFFLLLFFCLLLLVGCKKHSDLKESSNDAAAQWKVYYFNSKKEYLLTCEYELRSTGIDDKINEILNLLKETSGDKDRVSVLPSDVSIVNWVLTEEGNLICSFSPEYYKIDISSEVMVRAAIVKTLSQISSVKTVEFYVDNQPLVINSMIVGPMQEEQFLEGVGVSVSKSYFTLYYANAEKTALVPVSVEVELLDYYTPEQLVLTKLIEGTKQFGCISAIPENTKINHIVTRDGICSVDLNKAFLDYIPDMPAKLTIYSIVNSLAELTNVSKVVFTVDGETKDFYINLDLTKVFERSLELVEE